MVSVQKLSVLFFLAATSANAVFGQEASKLLSIELMPRDATLWGMKASQRFLVLGKFADGLERDVTSRIRFSLSHQGLAKIDQDGKVVALAEGQLELIAEIDGLKARAKLRIADIAALAPFSFSRDIGGIFTRRGCNSTQCHGSVKGRGGFKLSPDALSPRDDYEWITKGGGFQVLTPEPLLPRIPRINVKEPKQSLLLLKPTASVAHGGGFRFSSDSSDYATILRWVLEGAPFGPDDVTPIAKVERLEVFPGEAVLDVQGKQQLLVTGLLSNGQRQDMTDQVRYVSNNEEVVEVSEDGVVKAIKPGETSIAIHASGQEVHSIMFGVISKPISKFPTVAPKNFIDENIFAKLRRFQILPSELSSDKEFLRRVCLDLTGTLPPPQRVREFLASNDQQKRGKLIDILLASPEYVDYWTFRFADLFRANTYAQGDTKSTERYWEWIRDSVASNKPYDEIARERIAAQGYDGPSRHYFGRGGEMPFAQDMMAEQVRVFLGRRLDCAQCHNHPFEAWSQDQFWGMAAFYGRVTRLGQINGGYTVIIDDPAGGHGLHGESVNVFHPRTKQEVQPTFLDGRLLPDNDRTDLRLRLAEWITAPTNPYFAEAIVNRMWGYFFARGIVNPVDDFRVANPPTHPELLRAMAKDFREHRYDLKHLIATIVNSRTYQLSATPNATNQYDETNYSHALPRPLDAEVLLDAISQVTGVPEDFQAETEDTKAPPGTRAINLIWPDMFPSQFLDIYGRPNRVMIPERKVEANLAQALHQLAGSTYNAKLFDKGSRFGQMIERGASDQQIIEELYLAAFSRFPTAQEQSGLEGMMREWPSRREAVEDLAWGLMASQEFTHNH